MVHKSHKTRVGEGYSACVIHALIKIPGLNTAAICLLGIEQSPQFSWMVRYGVNPPPNRATPMGSFESWHRRLVTSIGVAEGGSNRVKTQTSASCRIRLDIHVYVYGCVQSIRDQ